MTDGELKRIGERGYHYAFSEHALALGPSMGGARALSLATVDALEGASRDLRWERPKLNRDRSRPLDASE